MDVRCPEQDMPEASRGCVYRKNPRDMKPEAMGSRDTDFWPSRNQNRDSGSRGRHTGPPARRMWGARGPEAGGPGKERQGQHPSSRPLLSLTGCSSDEADMAIMTHICAQRG